MKRRRLFVSSVSILFVPAIVAAYAVGCGSDDNSGTTQSGNDAAPGTDATTAADSAPSFDASSGDDAAMDSSPGVLSFEAGAISTAVYAGNAATLDASGMLGTADVTFTWTLMSAPAGSATTTASIQGAATATAIVPTDRVGAYVIAVTATAGGQTASATVTITAAAANVVYARADIAKDGGTAGSGWVVGSDGTNAHAFTCATPLQKPLGGAPAATAVTYTAFSASETFETAPGSATKVVFGSPLYSADGGTYVALLGTDTSASCPTDGGSTALFGAQTLYSTLIPVNLPGLAVAHPRFSPDGTRIAFNVSAEGSPTPDLISTVVVVNADGSSPTTIATVGEPSDASADQGDLGQLRQPEWIDNAHVGWVRAERADAGSTAWSFVSSSVPAVGAPRVVMACSGTTPDRAVLLNNGNVLAVVGQTASAPRDLVLYGIDASSNCTVVRNFTGFDAGGGLSGVLTFAVSPDQKTVAFGAHDSTKFEGDDTSDESAAAVVYVAPIDGSSAPVLLDPTGLDLGGLRWVGGGSQLAFTRVQADSNGLPTGTSSVAVVPFQAALTPDASATPAVGATVLSTGDAAVAVAAVASGDGGGCSASGSGSSGLAGSFLALFGLGFVRRRRVNSKG